MPKTVSVITLGGTISAQGGDHARLTGAQTLAAAPLPAGVDVELHDVRRLPGSSLALADLAELAGKVDEATSAGHGAVVVQGTDTLEETAFLLDVVCAPREPVVVTGAMRRPDLPGADGPANLAAALATAAAPDCRGLGVLTVLADEIHAARHVRKTHTTSVATFASPGAGPLGRVVEGVPRILLRPGQPTVERPLRLRDPARVALLTLSLGDGGELLEAVDDLPRALNSVRAGEAPLTAWSSPRSARGTCRGGWSSRRPPRPPVCPSSSRPAPARARCSARRTGGRVRSPTCWPAAWSPRASSTRPRPGCSCTRCSPTGPAGRRWARRSTGCGPGSTGKPRGRPTPGLLPGPTTGGPPPLAWAGLGPTVPPRQPICSGVTVSHRLSAVTGCPNSRCRAAFFRFIPSSCFM
ncbi:hypothetical protein GCM10010349_38570 [Streptomyces flavofungini]|nr:hypothetical protein GCM10010349_38570 [Streptomyces flavofungini]